MIALCTLGFIVGLALPYAVWRFALSKAFPFAIHLRANSTPKDMVRRLSEIAVRLDERPKCMRVTFHVPDDFILDIARDKRLVVRRAGFKPHIFDLRQRWIAEHPVPLRLNKQCLWIRPVDANRFRVLHLAAVHIPWGCYAALSLAFTAGIITSLPILLAFAGGAALACRLLEWLTSRARLRR